MRHDDVVAVRLADGKLPDPLSPRRRSMWETLKPFVILAGLLGAWFALNRWVLPRFGVKT